MEVEDMKNVIKSIRNGLKRAKKNVEGYMSRPSYAELKHERNYYKELNRMHVEEATEWMKMYNDYVNKMAAKES
jgi:hypothetical protein